MLHFWSMKFRWCYWIIGLRLVWRSGCCVCWSVVI